MESTQEGAVKLHDSEVILYSGLLSVISEEILILRHLLGDVIRLKKKSWEFTQLSQLLVSYKILVHLQKWRNSYCYLNYLH